MDVGDKVVEELLRLESVFGIVELLRNIWSSGSAVSSLLQLQDLVFNVKVAKIYEVKVER